MARAKRLWGVVDGEPFLTNPRLLLAGLNPKRRKKKPKSKGALKMARRLPPRHKSGPKKGQFKKRASGSAKRNPAPKRRRRRITAAPKRRRTRRSYASNPAPRRRRRSYAAPARRRRRSYRRNPMGIKRVFTDFLSAPTLKTVGFTVLGVTATPVVEGFAFNLLPASFQNKYVRYGVQLGSAYLVGNLTGRFLGREAGRAAYIGGAAYIAIGLMREFFPGILGATALGKYTGMGAQPLLGKYTAPPSLGSAMTYDTPERLQPASRF